MRQDAFIQARRIVGTQTGDVGARKRDIGKSLVLHAREVLRCAPARPRRFGDDSHMLTRVPFDESQLPGKDASRIAAEVGDVGHRHLNGRISQRAAHRRKPVPRNREQDGLQLVQPVLNELHQPVDVFAL